MPSSGTPEAKVLAGHATALPRLLESLLAEIPDDAPAAPPAVAEPVLNPVATRPLTREEAKVQQGVTDVPAWACQAFRALLFRVGAYRFAMPLVLMRGVDLVPARPTCVPGQARWHLGVVRHRGVPVVLADLGALLGLAAANATPRYLLLIGDGDCAIGCDLIEDAVMVEPDDVRWRARNRGPGWLAGLLIGPMCALLDPGVIGQQVRHG